MKLLILGAGTHGRVVQETAESTGAYEQTDFLDDRAPDAIGKLADYEHFRGTYGHAIAALGKNDLRSEWLSKLEQAGYSLATLIHPTAYVSPSASLEAGVVVLPLAAIHTRAIIQKGAIIGIGSLVDHDATVCEYSHINTGAIVTAGCTVKSLTKLEAGAVCSDNPINL